MVQKERQIEEIVLGLLHGLLRNEEKLLQAEGSVVAALNRVEFVLDHRAEQREPLVLDREARLQLLCVLARRLITTAGGHVLEDAADEDGAETVGNLREDRAQQGKQLHIRRGRPLHGIVESVLLGGEERVGVLDVRAGDRLAEHRVVRHHGQQAQQVLEDEEEVIAIVLHGSLLVGDENLLQTRFEHLEEGVALALENLVQRLCALIHPPMPTIHHRADRTETVHERGREVDVGSDAVHDVQLILVFQTMLPVIQSHPPSSYLHELVEMHDDMPSHQQRQFRLDHLRVCSSPPP